MLQRRRSYVLGLSADKRSSFFVRHVVCLQGFAEDLNSEWSTNGAQIRRAHVSR
jgi:hypothetical protein